MAELKQLRYETSMKEYQSQFEKLLTQVESLESLNHGPLICLLLVYLLLLN